MSNCLCRPPLSNSGKSFVIGSKYSASPHLPLGISISSTIYNVSKLTFTDASCGTCNALGLGVSKLTKEKYVPLEIGGIVFVDFNSSRYGTSFDTYLYPVVGMAFPLGVT